MRQTDEVLIGLERRRGEGGRSDLFSRAMVVIEEVINHTSAFRISKIIDTDKDENGQVKAVRAILLSSKDFDKHEIVLPLNIFNKRMMDPKLWNPF